MKWHRLYKESDEQVDIKKLLKQNGVTKLPSGTEFKLDRISWSKDGGYAGQKTLGKVCSQLEDAGWKRGEWRTGGVPDGSSVGNSNAYTSPDGQIVMTYYEYYGSTARDNSYGFTFKLIGGGLVAEDLDENGEESEPMIWKYHSDETFSVDEFVDKVHEVQQDIEDIFIQNRDFYTNMPEEEAWETFCDDMCDGQSPEESLGLDFYMNSVAEHQLPEDIRRYVYARDFDAMQWLRGIFERLMPICNDPVSESRDDMMIATLVKIDENGEKEIDMRQVFNGYDAIKLMEDYATSHADDDDWVAEKYAMFASGEDDKGKMQAGRILEKNGEISEKFLNGGYEIQLRLYESAYNESSRFGFNVGDKVELKDDVEPNRFSGRDAVPAGTIGEVVAIDKPMRGVIKVKLEDGTVVSAPERKLKFAGTDNDPWEKYKKPPEPPREPSEEDLLRARPEWIYMEPPKPGYPKWTGD